jgi:hypothetical protein
MRPEDWVLTAKGRHRLSTLALGRESFDPELMTEGPEAERLRVSQSLKWPTLRFAVSRRHEP